MLYLLATSPHVRVTSPLVFYMLVTWDPRHISELTPANSGLYSTMQAVPVCFMP